MYVKLRTPYQYFRDEMDRIPFDDQGSEAWIRSDLRKRRTFLYQFMIWSYLTLATALLAFPMWISTGIEQVLGVPLLIGAVTLIMFGSYKEVGIRF